MSAVDLKMDELDVTAAETKATYEEIREYVKEHTGLNVSNSVELHIANMLFSGCTDFLPRDNTFEEPLCG